MEKKLFSFKSFLSLMMSSLFLITGCNSNKNSSSSDASSSVSNSSSISEILSSSSSSLQESSSFESSSSVSSSSEESSSTTPVIKNYYSSANGEFIENNGVLTSNFDNSLAYRNDGDTFSEGTISCDIKLNGNAKDNGLIFGIINENNLSKYWEDAGIHYYFFFISNAGTAYLGKVSDRTWTVCSEVRIPNLNRNQTYTLKVSREYFDGGAAIRGYVNDEMLVSYKDYKYYDGTGYGVRAGSKNIEYSNIKTSKEILGATETLDGYYIANGSFKNQNGAIVSTTGNAIAEKQDGEFVYGTLEATMCTNGGTADNGIIFSLTSNETHSYWESDVSYYFFFINFSGGAYLGKVDYGSWTACQYATINGYNPNNTYTLKVEKDDTSISCYINNVLYFTHGEDFLLEGTGYGIRAGGNNVSFTNISCQSTGTIVETYPDNVDLVSGKFSGNNGAIKSKSTNSIALLKDTTLREGTFESYVKAVSSKRAGIIFNYSNNNGTESYYRFVVRKEAQKVEVDKVVNGTVTNLYSNYLSAGYSTGKETLFKVVIIGTEAHCYYGDNLYYVAEVSEIEGRVGLYAEGTSSQFRAYKTSTSKELITVDTLLFGHSYFELWSNYKNDFASVASSYSLGSYINIGIGGSVAAHWEKFKESLVKYDADTLIYMIGINDLTGGTSPASVVGSIEETLSYLKEYNSDLKVVLLSVNHCPARNEIRASISQTNDLMKNYCAQNDWILYAEMEYAFCDNGSTPNDYWFTDGLHPTAAGYTSKIIPAIKDALDGKNQPTVDESLEDKLLQSVKDLKANQLYDYDEYAYQKDEWETAKPIYEEAKNAIQACTTKEEVEALDLSSYISRLEEIKSNTDYFFEEFVKGTNNSVYETPTFKSELDKSTNGAFNLVHDGHRINNTYQYSDFSLNVCLKDINGETPTTSVIFRGEQTSTLGLNCYLMNIVTEPNYIQIWYLKDAYGTSGTYVLDYLGGWVFPGEVEETNFKLIVEGNMAYVYTVDDFLTKGKDAYGCSVDLTKNGTYTPYTKGGLGVLNWTTNTTVKSKLVVSNIRGKIEQ